MPCSESYGAAAQTPCRELAECWRLGQDGRVEPIAVRRLAAAAAVALAAMVPSACGGSPAVPSSGPVPLSLIAITDGLPDSLRLEWTGGADNATSWQYRTREWLAATPQAWSDWTRVPGGSSGSSHTFRLTGLRTPAAYDVQVRPLVGAKVGEASNIVEGTTASVGNRTIYPEQLVEGDGLTSWKHHGLSRPFIIPDGMRLRGGWAFIDGGCFPTGVSFSEVTTGSSIVFCTSGVNCEQGRYISADLDTRDVEQFFDQLGYLPCDWPDWMEDTTSKGENLGLAAVGVAAIGVYALAVWWVLRRR